LQKSEAILGIGDKFLGGAMTQSVFNRMESKFFFCSDAIVHEAEYGAKAGDAKLSFKATF
jgi:hypothetical protein